ncbi:MAG: type II secretion system secretin GspD [Labilithrix sp.]|nr:type II secretion system secretin GspD [Labilithrix sp.]MCW5813557.1 type II secretion system secretin GspD [Labilithrix sp.]
MKKRSAALALTALSAVPFIAGLAEAQPRIRDRSPRGDASAIPTQATPTPAAGGGTKDTTPTVGPNGKAQGDTQSLSQFESGLEFEPRSPNSRVTFSLEDADLGELVRVISQMTGKRFIFGPKVKNIKASVYTPQKITVAEAYQAFLSILEANKLTVVPHGRFLKIVDTDAIATTGTPVYGATEASPSEERYVTRLHRLGHISADDAAGVLGKFKSKEADITVYAPGNLIIITDTGTNIRRMMTILEEIDVGSSGDQIFFEPIHYSSAQEVEKRINELFDIKAASTPAAPARAGAAGSAPSTSASAGGGGELHVAKIVADDRTNSLIIVATERAYLRMLELIKRIDVPQTGEGEIHVLPLQHADATELTKTLTEIITGAVAPAAGTPPGRGAAAPAATPGAPPQGIFEGGVKVSADKATNSIVITSSLRDYVSLRAVIDRLDQPRRQVFIEAVIMDLQLKRSDALGVSFHGGVPFKFETDNDSTIFGGNKILNTIPPIPTGDPDALQGFALGVRGPGIPGTQNLLGTGISIPAFGTFIQAIARTGDTDLLSTPHILALDNEDAEINVGDNVPLQTNQGLGSLAGLAGGATGAAGAAGLGALAGGLGGFGAFGGVPRQDVGTKIKIKPHLNDSNEVRLDVQEEISEVGANVGGTSGAFNISKRTATTKLVVADQQTVVIGGLIRNVVGRSEEKVPVLGDIPVLGALFRKRTNQNEKRNLILVMTPYIIRNQQDLRTVFERKMQERQEYLDRYFVFSEVQEYTPPKDWSRTNGLVEDIRQSYFKLDERRRLDEIARPKDVKIHEPQQPIEMPQGIRPSSSGAGGAPPPTGDTPAPTRTRRGGTNDTAGQPQPQAPAGGGNPPVNVTPPTRNIERIER